MQDTTRTRSPIRPPARPERSPAPETGGTPLAALMTVWLAWLGVMAGANLAAPLYAVYAQKFGFSNLVLTLVFAAYGAVLVPSLLLFGRLSDRVGRRPVLLLGLAAAGAGLILFAVASSTVWLFAARAFQGLAVGMISGPATAALVELDPRRGEQRPALLAGLAQAAGSGLGPLISGALAQWAPDPLRLCFVAMLVVTMVAAGFTFVLPEPARGKSEPWRIQRPRVPEEIRNDFARVSLTAATVWGTLALFLSIVPSYAGALLETTNLALLGAIGAIALASSCAAQIVSQRGRRGASRRDQAAGLTVLALGLGGLALASPLHSLLVLIGAAVAAGAGHGFAFLDAQDELNAIAPPKRRGEVTAAFICCIYLMVSGAVIASGLIDQRLSLTVSIAAVACALAATALVAAVWQVRAAARERRPSGIMRS